MAGSYYVESLTDDLEREALELFQEIDALGGVFIEIDRWSLFRSMVAIVV